MIENWGSAGGRRVLSAHFFPRVPLNMLSGYYLCPCTPKITIIILFSRVYSKVSKMNVGKYGQDQHLCGSENSVSRNSTLKND